MWIATILQALFFLLLHAPELITSLQALFAFFKAHRNNPEISDWMSEFAEVLNESQVAKDVRPLQEFIARISAAIKG